MICFFRKQKKKHIECIKKYIVILFLKNGIGAENLKKKNLERKNYGLKYLSFLNKYVTSLHIYFVPIKITKTTTCE